MRYDRREIMLRAWEFVREGYSRSDALKYAWAEARLLKKRMTDEWRRESREWFKYQFSKEKLFLDAVKPKAERV